MTLKDFVIEMAGDLLADLGFTHNRNTTWVKVNENGIYFAVTFAKKNILGMQTLVLCDLTIQPIFAQLYNREYGMYEVLDGMNKTSSMSKFTVYLEWKYIHEDVDFEQMIERGRTLVDKTVGYLVRKVTDIESCVAANFEMNYFQFKIMQVNVPIEQHKMLYKENTFAMVLGLCKIKKYAEAIAILENCGPMSSMCARNGWKTLDDFLRVSVEVDEQKEWFINTIRNGEYEKLHEIMRHWYEINCEELKKKYKLTVDYQLSFDE